VDRCRRILERMSAQSAEPMGETPARIRMRDLLRQVPEQLSQSRRALLQVELADEELAAVLPARATVQSLVALVQNAFDATPGREVVVISARRSGFSLIVTVRDHGHGMPADVLRRIAEPFFTTKEPGKGMGLGTFLVRTFAESLGGRVAFDSVPGKGTTATLELPLKAEQAHVAV